MCGIVGHIGHPGTVEADIHKILDVLKHRGPDDRGIFHSPEAWIGHLRLSIIDIEGGHQPIPNEDKTMWVVCNGEIYNYQQLRQDLISRGHTFSTHSDSEVIIHLYEEMGSKCVEHLRGMFALAIWDDIKKQLFVARDRCGERPFYYSHDGSEFKFSSEIKGLLALNPTGADLNLEALDQYFAIRIIAPPLSMFKGIHKLPPGHMLTFDQNSGLKIERYWDLEFDPKLQGSDDELTDQLEEVLIDAIRLNMVSDVEVGSFLSAGFDSTLLLGILMSKVQSERIPTYTMGLPYGEYNEAPFARMVAEKYGTEHYEETVVPSMEANLARLIHHLDEPSDPLSVCSDKIAEMATKRTKVVLCGAGGDELYGGYDRYYANVYAGYYANLPQPLRKHVIGPVLNALPDGAWYKSKAHQLKWLHQASFLSGGERYARGLGYFFFQPEERNRLYGPVMKEVAKNFDPYAPLREAYDHAKAEHPIDKMLYADLVVRLPDHAGMIIDRTGMAHGIEARCPYLDHKVVEFSSRLPVRMKVRGRNLRYIQKRLCERYIPDELLRRQKQGMSSPLPYLLADEYRRLSDCFLRKSQLAGDGLLSQPAIDQIRQEHEQGKFDHGNRLWLLLNSEAWYRMRIQGISQDDLTAQITAGS